MKAFFSVGLCGLLLGCASAGGLHRSQDLADTTARDSVVETLHGEKVSDPYRWLENAKDPKVVSWMQAQDKAARSYLHALPHRDALLERLKSLAYVESTGVPLQRGGRLFFMRTHPDKEKGILYWKDGENGPEKVLLDPNA